MNLQILAPEVRLIDEETGTSSIVSRDEALRIAREREIDLVEVSPLATPPVVKFVDFGKFRYQQEKLDRKQKAKQKRVDVKGIRLSFKMSPHDREVRVAQTIKFLKDGDKVKIEMLLRGREQAHIDIAKKMFSEFVAAIDLPIKLDQELKRLGGMLSAIIMRT